MEEIFKVNTIKETEGIDLCDFTQDMLPTLAPPKNHQLHPPY